VAYLSIGTVTFLVAEIDGAIRFFQRVGDRSVDVLTEYRRLLRVAAHRQSGREVALQGAGYCFAFTRPQEALAAAVAAMGAIRRYPWPAANIPPVRVGLHTGEPLTGDISYAGRDVRRAACICAAGHGGQILLSQAVRDGVADDLPEGLSVRDLGPHRLGDLGGPQILFQVVTADLPCDFPPLKTLDAVPNNLPVQLTSFVGREREQEDIRRLLSTTRLLMLTGAGGCGKTRLALHVAANLGEEYPDGVWVVELAPLGDPTRVPRAVAAALGIPEYPGRPADEAVADFLRRKILLLVLDNCEHVLPACVRLADTLLRACPGVRVLATSREALRMAGEIAWRVPALSLPDPQPSPSLDRFLESEAVQLFVERAAAALPGFTVTGQTAEAIAQTCRRLDGIPLALELAAARVTVLSADQIAARLDERFRLLTGGSRTALPRQQTLRATMDWSYGLLTDQERTVLRRLSVFAGGWTLEAAEAVCAGGGVEASDILDLLTQLVNKSLVVADTQSGEARYRLLETVRQYGWNRLEESNETAAMRRRHRDLYLRLAESAEPKLLGPEQVVWLERLETEHDNLRAALEWSKMEEGGAEAWLRLAGALHEFWHMRGHHSEGREWLEGALSACARTPGPLRAKALYGAGELTWDQDPVRGEELLRESLSLFGGLKDVSGVAYSLHHLAHAAEEQAEYGRAVALFDESLARFREIGDRWGVGWSLHCLGAQTLNQGDVDRAKTLLEESLLIVRELGNTFTLAYVHHHLGVVAEKQGDYERATVLLERGLALSQHVGNKRHIPAVQCSLAHVWLHRGDLERAATLYRESLILRREIGEKSGLAESLEGLARLACAQVHYERTARILGAAEVLREATGSHRMPLHQVDHDQRVASVQGALGPSAFATAWAEGRAVTLERAIEYALTPVETALLKNETGQKPRIGRTRELLTAREREVATLVARGLTNHEIAQRLVVTQRTAETHVQNILNKLGVTSRAEIAAWAVECGLYTPLAH